MAFAFGPLPCEASLACRARDATWEDRRQEAHRTKIDITPPRLYCPFVAASEGRPMADKSHKGREHLTEGFGAGNLSKSLGNPKEVKPPPVAPAKDPPNKGGLSEPPKK